MDSHIQYIHAYNMQGNTMRRNVIRKVIHTNIISFISNNILIYIRCRFNRIYCQWYSPHGISKEYIVFPRRTALPLAWNDAMVAIYSVTKKDSSAPNLKWRDGGATLWRKINAPQSQQPLGQPLWLRHQNKVESGRANYGQVCAAVNCNNYTGTCEGLAFFTFPKDDKRYAHFIEFARYATSSIWLSMWIRRFPWL